MGDGMGEHMPQACWDRFLCEYALPHASDGTNHPLWTVAVATSLDPTSGRRVPLFTQHTTSTVLHLAVGHTFMAEYMRRFQPDLPLDELACPCGWPDASLMHLLYACPCRHVAQRLANPNLVWVQQYNPIYSPLVCYLNYTLLHNMVVKLRRVTP